MKPTKKFEERIKANLPKFKKVLQIAKDRDVTESDTVAIINDMLSEIFGYEKYTDITSELMIRGTFCDLAIRIDESFENGFLIECKRIGIELKEEHIRQAVNYGVNKGIKWVILTNGDEWRMYRIRFEQPVNWDLVLKFNLLNIEPKNDADSEKLFCISKEGIVKKSREEMYDKVQCFNRYVVGQLIIQEPVISLIRKELKKMSDGINIDVSEISALIKNGVLKRDILDIESDEVKNAILKVNKFYKQSNKPVKKVEPKPVETKTEVKPEMSITERLLAEATDEEIADMAAYASAVKNDIADRI